MVFYEEKNSRNSLKLGHLRKGAYNKDYPLYHVIRDNDKCIRCLVCVRQCSYEATFFDPARNVVYNVDENCVNCLRCVAMCPTEAISIEKNVSSYTKNGNWKEDTIKAIKKQADSGAARLTGLGSDRDVKVYFDNIVLDASQVTNPSIDPLREPMELRTFIGKKPDSVKVENVNGSLKLKNKLPPQIVTDVPIIFAPMSYGAINFNFQKAMAQAAKEFGTFFNTGEGGLHQDLRKYGSNAIVQVASGRFGVDVDYLESAAAVEIKVGQGAKPGIGGHLPGEKVTADISKTRMIPEGSDAISPAPHHDIYSIEDLRLLIYAIKEATRYSKPVSVKIAAVHNVAAIASGIARAGADIIAIDGYRGGTGAAPNVIRNNVGIPVELAIAQVDQRLRDEGIRNLVSIIAAGGIRSSGDIVKVIALGADAVYIGTAAMISVGCTLCQQCHRGICAWGITTNRPELAKRLDPDIATEQLYNLLRGWSIEIKEMLGLMGVNSIESLRGNRLKLRGVGLTQEELDILGIKHAGLQ